MTKRLAILCCVTGVFFFHLPAAIFAQTNSWTNSASGNWEDSSSWSLSILPGTNQDIMLTNSGWKALAIGPHTAQNFPETMTVDSITISAPSNSYNTLLLNYSGTQTPLTVQSLSVGSNSAVTLDSSALEVDGTMDIGGEINQNDSLVTGNLVDFGDIGPGVYNLNSGILAVSQLWADGTFNQNGGTNVSPTSVGGEYNLNGGYLDSALVGGGTLRQSGGILDSAMTIYGGNYLLEGGVHNGDMTDYGIVNQTGGTNTGDLTIGYVGYITQTSIPGSYTISNGLCSGGIDVEGSGTFTQAGGMVAASTVTLHSMFFVEKGGGETFDATMIQDGGTMSCSEMDVQGYYRQNGGTNFVAGTFYVSNIGWANTSGCLCASNVEIGGIGAALGGTLIISNELAVGDYGCSAGGHLAVSNINLTGGPFSFADGTIDQTGTLTLANHNLSLYGPGTFNLGQLSLTGSANLLLSSASGDCLLHLANSAAMAWTTNGLLNVEQWSGSLYGGGNPQIIFGSNSTALTPQQLSQIQFQNPAGLPAGNYPARILATGEIVPDTGAPLPIKMTIACCPTNPAMQLNLCGDIGQSYNIEVSTDLVNWTCWTNYFNANGSMSFDDFTTNCPQRFYRARLMP